jgi:hypothetical protein
MAAFSWAVRSGFCGREGAVCDFGRASCNGLDRSGDELGLDASPFALVPVLLFTVLVIMMVCFSLVQRVSLLSRHWTLRASAYARRSVAANAWYGADRLIENIVSRFSF